MQQPVCLGHGDWPERALLPRAGGQPFFPPAPDVCLVDVAQIHVAESGEQVVPEQAPVQLLGSWLQNVITIQLAAYSPNGMLPASGSIQSPRLISASLRVSQTSASLLSREGLRSGPVDPIRASVARLATAGRQLPDPAEVPFLAHATFLLFLVVTGSTSPAAMNSRSADSGMRT